MAQTTANRIVEVTTSSAQISPTMIGGVRRTLYTITNLSPTTVTIAKGDAAAVANQGIRLSQNQSWVEADNTGFSAWQGAIQAIASATSELAISETFEQ